MIKKTGFPSIIKIFDFDLTLTKHHTFQKFQLTEKIDAEKGIEEYLKGKKNAENTAVLNLTSQKIEAN